MDANRAKAFICDPLNNTGELGHLSDEICLMYVQIKAGREIEETKRLKLRRELENFFLPVMEVVKKDREQKFFFNALKIDYNSLEKLFGLVNPSREDLIIFFNQLIIDGYSIIGSAPETVTDKEKAMLTFDTLGKITLEHQSNNSDRGCF